jgi:hypothetical protein
MALLTSLDTQARRLDAVMRRLTNAPDGTDVTGAVRDALAVAATAAKLLGAL